MPAEPERKPAVEVADMREYLEEERRVAHIQVASLDRLLGYDSKVVCPCCGHAFLPKKHRSRDR